MYTIVKESWYDNYEGTFEHYHWTEKVYDSTEAVMKEKDEWLSGVSDDCYYPEICKLIYHFEITKRGWKYTYIFKDKREGRENEIWAETSLEIIDINKLERG